MQSPGDTVDGEGVLENTTDGGTEIGDVLLNLRGAAGFRLRHFSLLSSRKI
jgi:hypothetical protein